MTAPGSDRAGIRQVIRALRAAGYDLVAVDDGGEERIKVRTEADAIDAIMAVDCAHLIVKNTEHRGWIFFVLGNSPEEVICDHTVNLSPVLDPLIDSWI